MKPILFNNASLYTEMVMIRQDLSRPVDEVLYVELMNILLNNLLWDIKLPLDLQLKNKMQ